ncbi:hypothetical protein KKI93_26315, partial [Xenorhabdus bovienii]|nr:hypothetical protein [Xenorhabdus bovienii]
TEREYLLKMLSSLCIDPQINMPPDAAACRQIISMAIDIAYKKNSDTEPVRYGPSLIPEVDNALKESGCLSEHDSQWWELATWY